MGGEKTVLSTSRRSDIRKNDWPKRKTGRLNDRQLEEEAWWCGGYAADHIGKRNALSLSSK